MFYNSQLPTNDNDIYNIGDETQKSIKKSLTKQKHIIQQNEILANDDDLNNYITEKNVD